jgi:hypothetical protein
MLLLNKSMSSIKEIGRRVSPYLCSALPCSTHKRPSYPLVPSLFIPFNSNRNSPLLRTFPYGNALLLRSLSCVSGCGLRHKQGPTSRHARPTCTLCSSAESVSVPIRRSVPSLGFHERGVSLQLAYLVSLHLTFFSVSGATLLLQTLPMVKSTICREPMP